MTNWLPFLTTLDKTRRRRRRQKKSDSKMGAYAPIKTEKKYAGISL